MLHRILPYIADMAPILTKAAKNDWGGTLLSHASQTRKALRAKRKAKNKRRKQGRH
jgi:hypothetical protein